MAQKLKLVDGSILKVDNKEVYEATNLGVVKQVDVAARKMTMVGTDESIDRDGDIIRMNGWQLENYRKNPVFLWAHNYSSVPLARAEKVVKKREPLRMEYHLLFPTKGLHPFADMILELYGEKIINASSVGFIPLEWEDIKPEDEKGVKGVRRTWGREYRKQELLELSGCAVPANPNALQDALKGKSFLDMPFEEVQKWIQGETQPPSPNGKIADIMGELSLKMADFVDETKPFMIQVPKNLCLIEDEESELPSITEEEIINQELVDKPYPNEHACRLESPDKYDRFARKNCFKKHDGKCIDFIFGIKEGKSETQAMRYKKDVWTASAAKSHCGTHNGTFEAAKGVEDLKDVPLETFVEIIDGFKEEMKGDIGLISLSLKDLDSYIRLAVKEVLEALKSKSPIGTDLALPPTDQSSSGGGKGKSASEAILGEAFERGKGKEPQTLINPAPQYDFEGLRKAIGDLRDVLKPLKL